MLRKRKRFSELTTIPLLCDGAVSAALGLVLSHSRFKERQLGKTVYLTVVKHVVQPT